MSDSDRPPCARCGEEAGQHPEFACERYIDPSQTNVVLVGGGHLEERLPAYGTQERIQDQTCDECGAVCKCEFDEGFMMSGKCCVHGEIECDQPETPMSKKPTLEDVQNHIMDHVQDLTKLEHQLVGIKRQVLCTYEVLEELLSTEGPLGLKALQISQERLRELIKDEEDLPVEVGTPFSPDMGHGRTAAPFSPPEENDG